MNPRPALYTLHRNSHRNDRT